MPRRILRLFSCVLLLLAVAAAQTPTVTHYDLALRVFPAEHRFQAEAKLRILNIGPTAVSEIPLLLYPLLHVDSVTGPRGAALKFTQEPATVAGREGWKVLHVKVGLAQPLAPAAATELSVKYGGRVEGYESRAPYIHDRIGEEVSLLREDSLFYPLLALPVTREYYAAAQNWQFTFNLKTTVPKGYVAACGGERDQVEHSAAGDTYTCASREKNYRIDVAIAKYREQSDSARHLQVYAFSEDAAAAGPMLKGMAETIDFYRDQFGEIPGFAGYAVIEIPEGWGSQAATGYILQTAAAFKDTADLRELYHEIAHTWNARAKTEVQRTRWFDEAFASYFQALAQRRFQGEAAFQNQMERYRKHFLNAAAKDARNSATPIAEYGKEELGENSYTKGAWSLYVLNQVLGDQAFRQVMRQFIAEHREQPADFADFRRAVEQTSGRKLDQYFAEWIFGAESSRLLADGKTVQEIAARYAPEPAPAR